MHARKLVPEGYKSGTYAFIKHLPSAGIPTRHRRNPTLHQLSFTEKKCSFEYEEEKKSEPPVASTPGPALSRSRSLKGSGFCQAVERKDVKMAGTEEFGEAEFLRPVDEMEELGIYFFADFWGLCLPFVTIVAQRHWMGARCDFFSFF